MTSRARLQNLSVWAAGGCLLGALVVGGVIALAPITASHGDGEQACGSLLDHIQVTDAAPATIATKDYPASPGSPGVSHFDACPAEDFEGRQGMLVVAAPIAGIVVAAVSLLARQATRPAT